MDQANWLIVFCVRQAYNVSFIQPTNDIEKLPYSSEDPVVLFKGAFKHGNYYIYHKDSLQNDKFDDSS